MLLAVSVLLCHLLLAVSVLLCAGYSDELNSFLCLSMFGFSCVDLEEGSANCHAHFTVEYGVAVHVDAYYSMVLLCMLPGVLCCLLYGVAVHVAWCLLYGVAVHVAWCTTLWCCCACNTALHDPSDGNAALYDPSDDNAALYDPSDGNTAPLMVMKHCMHR